MCTCSENSCIMVSHTKTPEPPSPPTGTLAAGFAALFASAGCFPGIVAISIPLCVSGDPTQTTFCHNRSQLPSGPVVVVVVGPVMGGSRYPRLAETQAPSSSRRPCARLGPIALPQAARRNDWVVSGMVGNRRHHPRNQDNSVLQPTRRRLTTPPSAPRRPTQLPAGGLLRLRSDDTMASRDNNALCVLCVLAV